MCPHSEDWLLAVLVTSCGLRLVDKAVHVAVNCSASWRQHLRCPHCRCGATADTGGTHGLVCKQASSRIARHQAINDVISSAISSAGIHATKEPGSLTRLDGKWPDGLTLIPWHGGKPLTWDLTVVSTLACRLLLAHYVSLCR